MKSKCYSSFITLFLVGLMSFAQGQEIEVKGTVSGDDGVLLPGASVLVKGTTNGTQTDFDGNFTITANQGDILVVSYLGFTTQEVATADTLNITLQEDASELDEVVVTALGIQKEKRALGYAVTKVGGDELEQKAEADVANSLQGKIAGVQIVASSGSTGNTPDITIRSSLSINTSNSPLIIVNNVPFNGTLIDIDPNDIKELNVLKGLNASILYGSEGRNGVILIQTKSGSGQKGAEKMSVSVSQTVYTNTVASLPEYQNKYGTGSDGGYAVAIGSWGPPFSELATIPHPYANNPAFPEFAGVEIPYEAARNNIEDFFNTGIGNVTAVNVATSQEKSSFNISAGYTDETGIIGNNNLKRFNLGTGGSAQLTDKLDINATLNYATRKRNSQSGTRLFDRLLYLPRNLDVYNLPSQNPATGANEYYRPDQHPLWLINNSGRNDDVVRIFGTFNAGYAINDNLKLNYRIGYDSQSVDEFDYQNRGGIDDPTGFLILDYDKEVVIDQSIILNASYDLSEKIGLDAQLGINSKYSNFKSNYTEYTDQNVFGFLRPSNFNAIVAEPTDEDDPTENIRAKENLAGAFGQLEFSYDRFLYVTLSGRNDWGSTVEPENRQLFYPGASVSFLPTSAFNMNSKILNYLKLRGAYATSSGYPNRYLTRTILEANSQRFITGGDNGSTLIGNSTSRLLANPNLKPELHKEVEVGIESKLFDNRVSLDASAFKRISEDQIVQRALDGSTGFTSTFTNIGQLDTKGLEIDLGIDILNGEKFKWNFRNIFTAYETIVVELEDDQLDLGGRNFAIEGQPLGILQGSFALRDDQGEFLINPNNGELIISDEIGQEDRIIGNPAPDWTLTNINSFSYKNFTLFTQLEYFHGGENFSDFAEDLIERGVTRDTENREGSFVLPGVYGDTGTGLPFLDANGRTTPNDIQLNANRTAFSNYYNADDLSTFDTSVFRIREIALSYTLDGKKNRLPFDNIAFTLSGRNIFYNAPGFPEYTNIDPATDTSSGSGSSTVPTTKRYAFGISVSF